MTRERMIATLVLKHASKTEAAGAAGAKALQLLGRGAAAAGRGAVHVLEAGGAVGRGAAKAMGGSEALGTGLGVAATGLAGLGVANAAYTAGRARVDEWRARNGLLPAAYYY